VARTSTLPEHLQPMLATLTVRRLMITTGYSRKYDGFRVVATLHSRNGKIIRCRATMSGAIIAVTGGKPFL
jgi:hypothetical protein